MAVEDILVIRHLPVRPDGCRVVHLRVRRMTIGARPIRLENHAEATVRG